MRQIKGVGCMNEYIIGLVSLPTLKAKIKSFFHVVSGNFMVTS
jgi:hypothetical protein